MVNICSFAAIEWLLYSLVCYAKYGVQDNAQLITAGSGHKMHNSESGPQILDNNIGDLIQFRLFALSQAVQQKYCSNCAKLQGISTQALHFHRLNSNSTN